MASTARSKALAKTRSKVRAHRERMRKLGLRPIQIWVPDVTSPEFIREARRQSRLIAEQPEEAEVMDWLDSVRDTTGWDPQ
jgi:hypothetical protein